MSSAVTMEKVVSLAKRRGFIFPGSEIYGGLANTWDYGPYGVELKNNVKQVWWKMFVQDRTDMVGLDASILMNPRVWEASGHVSSFSDPLMDCRKCKERVRGDKLIEEHLGIEAAVGKSLKEISKIIHEKKLPCPKCGATDFTEARSFNLMFKTHQGVIEEETALVYMRPETAQGIFVNFKNVVTTTRMRLPFGIGQIGKAFRNEITPGNFTFRTREFEQMEIEYFFDPEATKWEKLFEDWKKLSWNFVKETLGISEKNLRLRDHEKDELSHYSRGTTDIEYLFPFGWGELCAAAAYRTDFDLTQHQKFSGQDLSYTDPENPQRKVTAHVIEPSFGADRITLAVLLDAYDEEDVEGETRVVLRFARKLAPIKAAVLPLVKNKEVITDKAREVYHLL
ncbi:MAG TPA: glycine--tRNA ligase, partial [Candidatus Gracilibacteria bacterium]|nr:glycine--tRNA ligase [Candidatus Gracilibacteria bacterium]